MHRDVVSWCLSSGPTCFVITGSVDGHVKVNFSYYTGFWPLSHVSVPTSNKLVVVGNVHTFKYGVIWK